MSFFWYIFFHNVNAWMCVMEVHKVQHISKLPGAVLKDVTRSLLRWDRRSCGTTCWPTWTALSKCVQRGGQIGVLARFQSGGKQGDNERWEENEQHGASCCVTPGQEHDEERITSASEEWAGNSQTSILSSKCFVNFYQFYFCSVFLIRFCTVSKMSCTII